MSPATSTFLNSRPLIGVAVAFAASIVTAGESLPDALSGGAFTVADESELAYSLPGPVLDAAQVELFANGRQEFHQHWVPIPSTGGKWGRGPTSNAEGCIDCHANNGRGHAPDSALEPLASMIVRLSLPGEDEHGGARPHPDYGDQLQVQGELGKIPAEGSAAIAWIDREEKLADGTVVLLRSPRLVISNLNYGALGADILTSVRIAPPVFGSGLIDAVAESDILELARRQRESGFNGRPNVVWDEQKQAPAIGRFGWKASQPSLRQQDAAAFLNDMGVTTRLFMRDNCPGIQAACRKRPIGMIPEQQDRPFGELLFYTRALAVPARRHVDDTNVVRGQRLFAAAQCAICHAPDLKTADYPDFPGLAHQAIHPYTDLLLHDMGDGLADGRPDFRAGPRDWRTPPLWGIGLSGTVNGNAALLHDGRARNVTEAILWHDGEAASAREAFRAMSGDERAALLAFVNSL
ncbi:MAG TPA: di-heme oxidoredictase family protein [Burkholderiales bacterium]|nr:di-heme oxidoredictase family protein [Burkholderiales bacterium]